LLIAIEGVDGSGKETQTGLLLGRLKRESRRARTVMFPNYASEAAGAVKMYLNGDFGVNPNEVNPFAASTFFAVDRYASYKTDWGCFYESGGIVVADRYTMSNMIHQGAKIPDAASRQSYYNWLVDFEYVKLGLPEPDIVIFLDLSMELRIQLIEKRLINNSGGGGAGAFGGGGGGAGAVGGSDGNAGDLTGIGSAAGGVNGADYAAVSGIAGKMPARQKLDIHERSREYLNLAHICAREAADQFGWKRIAAERDGALRDKADVHHDIYEAIAPLL
jgi:dTMP kinase